MTNDSAAALQPWFGGKVGAFSANSGAADSYAAANVNSSRSLNGAIDTLSVSVIPEPGTISLAALALVAAGSTLRRRAAAFTSS